MGQTVVKCVCMYKVPPQGKWRLGEVYEGVLDTDEHVIKMTDEEDKTYPFYAWEYIKYFYHISGSWEDKR